ncbi:Leucine-rich repeat receptor-like kinase protein SUNN [Labeo rohita]|uniref:Leucine-rich repeat receptor-like kinase protein SUNN n=1 Tax=Labeo rohita TaxID=84645 RepID=A0ABQ8M794_LABRO|nr:Leucine-rich repeat receptor-like kinase protein SUNN [Labeo rohita]
MVILILTQHMCSSTSKTQPSGCRDIQIQQRSFSVCLSPHHRIHNHGASARMKSLQAWAPTKLVRKPEPDTIKAPESMCTDQYTPEPGANLDLIDLGSMDPIPNQVPTLKSLSSFPVPYRYLDDPVPFGDLPLSMLLPDSLVPVPWIRWYH